MKILRVAGVVVGIHAFALLFLLANPGCSSASKPTPAPSDTVANTEPSPMITVPSSASDSSPIMPASSGGDSSSTVSINVAGLGASRYSPTRPGTPAASALEAQPVADVIPATTYTVVSGDSLIVAARKNKISVAELIAANNLKQSSVLRPGQKLIIPAKTPPVVSVAPAGSAPMAAAPDGGAQAPAEVVKHTVQNGETLGAIARKYHVTLGELMLKNKVADPKKIQTGQDLIIPSPTASKAVKPAPTTATPAATTRAAAPAAAKPAAPSPAVESKPVFVIPPPGQDLDAGLKPGTGVDVPVNKVEEISEVKKP